MNTELLEILKQIQRGDWALVPKAQADELLNLGFIQKEGRFMDMDLASITPAGLYALRTFAPSPAVFGDYFGNKWGLE